MRWPFALLALAASPAIAQGVVISTPQVDTSQFVTQGQAATIASGAAAAAIAADTTHATSAALTSLQATIPTAAVTVPGQEMIGGSAGTAGTYRPGNALQPRISRTDTFSIAGSQGMLTVAWDNPLPATNASGTTYGSYPVFFTPIGGANTAPVKWKVISASSTGFTAQCMQEVSTLNFTLSALTAAGVNGLLLPVSAPCPAGTQVYVLQLPSAR